MDDQWQISHSMLKRQGIMRTVMRDKSEVAHQLKFKSNMKTIGLLGGVGWASTITYYKMPILSACRLPLQSILPFPKK